MFVKILKKSFISLAATLIPCAILLNYYLDNDYQRIIDSTKEYDYNFDVNCDVLKSLQDLKHL